MTLRERAILSAKTKIIMTREHEKIIYKGEITKTWKCDTLSCGKGDEIIHSCEQDD